MFNDLGLLVGPLSVVLGLLVGPDGLLLPSFPLALLGPLFIPKVSWGPLSFFKSSGETVPRSFESPFGFEEGGTFDPEP